MPALPQYLYRIQPVRPEMLTEGATPEESAIVSAHFHYLQDLTAKGVVLLAGRTQNTDLSSFGIIIFQAESDEAARQIMHDDPAVQNRVFRAELFPYRIALTGAALSELMESGKT
ncbi:MAG: YciI family protein [Anaerolineae bacterium]|nr:YciI family protein [Anaerolineae bacterium]